MSAFDPKRTCHIALHMFAFSGNVDIEVSFAVATTLMLAVESLAHQEKRRVCINANDLIVRASSFLRRPLD